MCIINKDALCRWTRKKQVLHKGQMHIKSQIRFQLLILGFWNIIRPPHSVLEIRYFITTQKIEMEKDETTNWVKLLPWKIWRLGLQFHNTMFWKNSSTSFMKESKRRKNFYIPFKMLEIFFCYLTLPLFPDDF